MWSQNENRDFPITEYQIYDKPRHENSVFKEVGRERGKLQLLLQDKQWVLLLESVFQGSHKKQQPQAKGAVREEKQQNLG